MKNFGDYPRACVYSVKGKSLKGYILDDYEECGGPQDGQIYIIVLDKNTHEEVHVKKEDVLEIIE